MKLTLIIIAAISYIIIGRIVANKMETWDLAEPPSNNTDDISKLFCGLFFPLLLLVAVVMLGYRKFKS